LLKVVDFEGQEIIDRKEQAQEQSSTDTQIFTD
jgi:hypothetical protein